MKSSTFIIIGLFFIITSFTIINNKNNTKRLPYKWFYIHDQYPPGSAVPRHKASYLGEGIIPPEHDECFGDNYMCVAGFRPNQVYLDSLNGSQVPEVVASLRDN